MPANVMHWAVYTTVGNDLVMMASFFVKSDADEYQDRLSSSGWDAWVESLND